MDSPMIDGITFLLEYVNGSQYEEDSDTTRDKTIRDVLVNVPHAIIAIPSDNKNYCEYALMVLMQPDNFSEKMFSLLKNDRHEEIKNTHDFKKLILKNGVLCKD